MSGATASGNDLIVQLIENSTYDTAATPLLSIAANTIYDTTINKNILAPLASVSLLDGAAPVAFVARTQDTDHNGKIDHILLEISEAVTGSLVPSLVTGYSLSGSSMNTPSGYLVAITELGSYDSGALPTVTLSGSSLKDFANYDLIVKGSWTTLDNAEPIALSSTTADTNLNGHIDSINLVFSENMSGTTLPIGVVA